MNQQDRHSPEEEHSDETCRVRACDVMYRRWAFRLLTVACTLVSAQLPFAALAADSDAIEAALRNTRLGKLLP